MRRWVAGVIVLLLAGACGGDSGPEGVAGSKVKTLSATLVPGEVLGLAVAREDVADALAAVDDTYLDGFSVYSFRNQALLQASLQVAQFSEDADVESADFRSSIIDSRKIGGSAPQQIRVGKTDVWLTSGNRQRISVWFKGDYLFVLATRDDYPRPRALLRKVLEVTA